LKNYLKTKIPGSLKKLYWLLSRREKGKVIGLFGMMMVAAVLEVAGIGMVPAFVSIVTSPEKVMQYPVAEDILKGLGITTSRDLLFWGAIALIGIFVVKNAYLVLYNYFQARFVQGLRYEFSTKLMNSYMQAPYTFHLQRNSAQLLRNATQEVQMMTTQALRPLMMLGKEGIMILSILVFLLAIEPLITLLVFALLGTATGLFLSYTQKRVKQYGKEDQRMRQQIIKNLNQGVGGIKDARVLNREPLFIDKFSKAVHRSATLNVFKQFFTNATKPFIETVAVGGMLLIAVLMVWQGRSMEAIMPTLTLFATASIRLMPASQLLMKNLTTLRYGIVTIEPIYRDVNELAEYRAGLKADREKMKGERLPVNEVLSANNLHYHYPKADEKALNGLDFSVNRGKAVAFTGPSGAGKTTIVDILLGLLEPQQGTIEVDGHSIYNNLSAWQRNIGYIPQHIYLADETLKANIAFGIPNEEIDEDKVWEALKLARLEEMVNKLPKGLNTIIGERGTRLSGGQRQRVGIARALYHDPQVLVMDEATSALDNITEKQIINAIDRLKGERTVIMIAHRLTTVENCDKIYFMREGQVKSVGTYQELMEVNEQFRALANGTI
jgi:ATP-binding cassette subfamily C protein